MNSHSYFISFHSSYSTDWHYECYNQIEPHMVLFLFAPMILKEIDSYDSAHHFEFWYVVWNVQLTISIYFNFGSVLCISIEYTMYYLLSASAFMYYFNQNVYDVTIQWFILQWFSISFLYRPEDEPFCFICVIIRDSRQSAVFNFICYSLSLRLISTYYATENIWRLNKNTFKIFRDEVEVECRVE
jgi:hypothetical protein